MRSRALEKLLNNWRLAQSFWYLDGNNGVRMLSVVQTKEGNWNVFDCRRRCWLPDTYPSSYAAMAQDEYIEKMCEEFPEYLGR